MEEVFYALGMKCSAKIGGRVALSVVRNSRWSRILLEGSRRRGTLLR